MVYTIPDQNKRFGIFFIGNFGPKKKNIEKDQGLLRNTLSV